MSNLVVYSARVMQFKRRHHWKESRLSLHKDGTLTWYRKDGYQVKSSVFLPDILQEVKVETPDDKHHEKLQCTPFFVIVPVKRDENDKVTVKRFAVMNGPDLALLLDAFATVVDEWKIFKDLREKHREELANSKEMGVDIVESSVSYHELVYYYKSIWEDYIHQHGQNKRSKNNNSAGNLKILF